MVRDKSSPAVGLGVDADGEPVVDPTQNVLQLVAAAVMRLDDLRDAEARRVDELRHEAVGRNDDLRNAESRRVDEQMALRANYEDKLAVAEAKRIDAIRSVDVNAVGVASQRAADQATVLANQVASSAETLRKALDSTAASIASQMDNKFASITERIAALEKASYTGEGKGVGGDAVKAVNRATIGIIISVVIVVATVVFNLLRVTP